MKRRAWLKLGVLAAFAAPAFSQTKYPERPIRLIVPFAPGGNVVVENRAGAGGAIGATEAARARADGYTLLLGTTTTQIINPAAQPAAQYDALKDFALVGMLSVTATCIVVNPALPAGTLKELVALIRAHPGKYSYGSAGPGTITNLTGELFKLQAGRLEVTHVPYKGGGPAMQDLIAGHIPIITPILSSAVLAQHRAGRARILGVNSDERVKTAPEIPTSIEGGVPGMQVEVFSALFAPSETPPAALEVLRQATLKVRSDPAFLQDLEKAGAEPFAQRSEAKYLGDEVARWKQLIKATGFTAQ
jgi:tripartite-type tricarboxylate transporter receptor subunit TctC